MKILNLFNLQTFLALVISQVAAFLTIHYQIKFQLDLLLFSLVVVFPLHFSLQAAFERRDRALEYFSLYKAGATALSNSFHIAEDLPAEKKTEAKNLLIRMTDQLIHQLEYRVINYATMQDAADKIMAFIEANRGGLSNRNVLRMIRYLRDVTESSTYLISLVRHRTMLGLRFYSVIFILIFPLVQAPIIYSRLGDLVQSWVIYLLLGLGSLILVMLSTFQQMIEYPFDGKGIDNIRLRDFSLNLAK